MSEIIKSFHLSDHKGGQGYKRVLLQLFGLPGNGKSSFINSCKFVIDGGMFVLHAETANSQGGNTTDRLFYDLTETIGMVDNRGMPTLDRFQTGEIFAQLGNLLPLNQKVEWVEDFNTNVDRITTEFHKEDNLYDLIVPVFIHSVTCKIQHDKNLYIDLLSSAQDLTGVNPYIVLTHKDRGGVEDMKSVFRDMGLGKIYIIENYTSVGQPLVREKHKEIIAFLTEVLEDIRFRMTHMKDPREEKSRRLKFIIKYIKKSNDIKRDEEQQRRLEEAANNKKTCVLF